jgi:hypothetical protein
MIGKLFGTQVNAALVLALSGTVVALVANGPGRVSLKQVASGILSNPVPRREPSAVGEAPVLAPLRAAA